MNKQALRACLGACLILFASAAAYAGRGTHNCSSSTPIGTRCTYWSGGPGSAQSGVCKLDSDSNGNNNFCAKVYNPYNHLSPDNGKPIFIDLICEVPLSNSRNYCEVNK